MSLEALDWLILIGKTLFVLICLLQVAPIMLWVERRGSALMQNRLGPNRVGPWGLLQAVPDALKFIFKEDRAPGHVEKFYYNLAPIISVTPAFMAFLVIPFASTIVIGDRTIDFRASNLDIGLLYIFAISSLSVYGVIMAAWASNNKYALFGGLRSTAQMISYELSLGLSVVGILLVFSTVDLMEIARLQGDVLMTLGPITIPKWGIFVQPLAFVIFLTAVYAETNRLPFDLPEGESEIVAGYHLEYGAMKFAFFMMAEYVHMMTGSALAATLFFGGWQMLPGLQWILDTTGLMGLDREWLRIAFEGGSFFAKVAFSMWLFVWIRWTLPRFRYDQLMDLGWKVMLPLSLINIFATALIVYYGVI